MISLFSNSAFATDPDISVNDTGTGMCVYDVLDTYSGTAGFKANWEANNIKLRWYNGNTQLDVQSNANDCDYNGGLNVPSNTLTRTGYTFSGWTRRPEMDFSTIPTNINGTEGWSKVYYSTSSLICVYKQGSQNSKHVACDSDSNFKELQLSEWKAKFSHGDVYGMSLCSETNGTFAQSGIPSTTLGANCWCKATGYKATNANVISRSEFALNWVFERTYPTNCRGGCPAACALGSMGYSSFRTALFTPISNQ